MKAKEAKKNASTAPVAKKDKFVGNAAGATVGGIHLRRPPYVQYIYTPPRAVSTVLTALSSPRAWSWLWYDTC